MAFAQSRLQIGRHDSRAELGLLLGLVALAFAAALTRGPVLPVMALAGVATFALALAKPHAGLYLIMFTVVLGDLRIQDPNRSDLEMLLQSFEGTGVTPLEMLLVLTAIGVAIRVTFDENIKARGGELLLPIAGLLLAVGIGGGIGLSRGANFEVLRQEMRGFFYLPLAYIAVVHLIRTKPDLSRFLWIFVIVVNLASAEAIYRYFTVVRSGTGLAQSEDLAFAHENAIFCAAAIIILFSRIIWSGSPLKESKSIALLALPFLALLVMRRRAGIVALDGGLILLCVILLRDNFRLFLMTIPVAIVGAGLLLAVTWNQPGGTGQFARSFRTVTGQESTIRDQSSDEYRAIELANVRANIQDEPLIGLGFGREYVFYYPLADLSAFWQLYPYVPHNSVMWVWMKAGIIGFVALLGLFTTALMRSTQLTLSQGPGILKSAAFAFGAIVFMFVLYSWVDLGLISSRALVLFAFALGGIAAVSYLAREDQGEIGSASG